MAPEDSNACMVPMPMPMPVALITRIHLIRLGALTAAVIKDAAVAHGGGILWRPDVPLRFRVVEKVANGRLGTGAAAAGHATAWARAAIVSRVGNRNRSSSAGDG